MCNLLKRVKFPSKSGNKFFPSYSKVPDIAGKIPWLQRHFEQWVLQWPWPLWCYSRSRCSDPFAVLPVPRPPCQNCRISVSLRQSHWRKVSNVGLCDTKESTLGEQRWARAFKMPSANLTRENGHAMHTNRDNSSLRKYVVSGMYSNTFRKSSCPQLQLERHLEEHEVIVEPWGYFCHCLVEGAT